MPDNDSAADKTDQEEIQNILNRSKAAKEQIDALASGLQKTSSETLASISAEVEKARSTLANLKSQAENDAAELDKSKTAAATIKGAIEIIQKNASTDAANINQSKLDVEKLQAAAKAKADSLDAEHSAINSKIASLQSDALSLEKILEQIGDLREQAEAANKSVETNIKAITDTKGAFDTLKTQTQEQYDNLLEARKELDEQIEDIKNAHSGIDEFFKILTEDDGDKKSIKTEIQALQSKISEVLSDTTKQRDVAKDAFETFKTSTEQEISSLTKAYSEKFDTLYSDLTTEIRSLLPSAGAAGLASTYYDAKSRYAPTSFSEKPGHAALERRHWWSFSWKRVFGYNPASLVATIAFYSLFILPILGIVYIFYGILNHLPNGNIANLDLKILALRVLIALPLATISAFGFSSLRTYRRLYEEYNHKQRVMELFTSFQKEMEKSGTDEQKQRLLTIMLDAVADKSYLASTTPIDNKASDEVLAKLNNISGALNNFMKLKPEV